MPAARPVGAPCVSIVQLGVTSDGRDLYVDLEALGVLAVDAAPDRADAVVTAIAATLGTSVLAEVSQLVGVGLDPAAFVGHRHHVGCDSFDAALDLATSLLGSTALASESTFALRSRVAGGEAWEPAIVLVASDFVGEVGGALPDQVGAGAGGGRRRTARRCPPHADRPGIDVAARPIGHRRRATRPRSRRTVGDHRARRARDGSARSR